MKIKDRVEDNLMVFFVIGVFAAAAVVGVFATQGSIFSSQQSSVKFYSVYDHDFSGADYDPTEDYSASSNSPSIAGYSIEINDFGTRGNSEGCGANYAVRKSGEKIVDDEVVDADGWADNLEDKNLDGFQRDGWKFQFGNPIYMDAIVHEGQFFGVECQGSFQRIEMPVYWDEISFDVDLPEESERDTTALEVVSDNSYRPLKLNLSLEACDGSGFCTSRDLEMYSVPEGNRVERFDVPVASNTSVSVTGEVYLDMEKLSVSGLSTRKTESRDIVDASEIEVLKIGEVSYEDNVVRVEPEEQEPVNPPGTNESSGDNVVNEGGEEASGFWSMLVELWNSLWYRG